MAEEVLQTYQRRVSAFQVDESSVELGQRNASATEYNRVKIHQRDLRNHTVEARLTRVEYGTWEGQTACLVALKFSFHSSGSKALRFTRGSISVGFTSRDTRNRDPAVVNFGPKRLFGSKTSGSLTWSYGGAFSFKATAGPVEIGPEVQATRDLVFERQYLQVINVWGWGDRRHVEPNHVKCSLDENPLEESGIPEELSLTMIVTFEGAFQARVSVGTTAIFDLLAYPWTKDDPVLFQPGVSYGPAMRASGTTDFATLTRAEWEKLVTASLDVR